MKKLLLTFVEMLLPMMASAQEVVEINGIHYSLSEDDNTASVYNNDALGSPVWIYKGDVVIPPTIEYQGITYNVTSIGDMAFWDAEITSISIPNSINYVGNRAFQNCNKLVSLTLPNSVEYFGGINSSSLKTLVLSENLKYLGGCHCNKLRSLTIPSSVERIESFSECNNLTSIAFGNGIMEISKDAFVNCAWYDNLPDGVIYIGDLLFGYKGKMPANTNIIVKDGTKTINSYALQDETQSGVWSAISEDYSGLKSVMIPNSVTSIGTRAFLGCTNLESITIPNSVSKIGYLAFEGTAWYKNQSNGVVYAGNVLYSYKGSMPDNTKITVKDGTIGIADYAFGQWRIVGLTSITIPQTVKTIGEGAFQGCDELASITIPDGITSINDYCFNGCSNLTSIDIPEGVTSIGRDAFSGCGNLTTVMIPQSMTRIGEYAFGDLSNLSSVHITDLGAWCKIRFDGYIGSNPLSNGGRLFINGNEIKDLIIPSSVTRIGSYAFCGCSSFTSVTIPKSVKSIGNGVFWGCKNLTSVITSNNLAWIGNEFLAYCTNLNSISIGNSLKRIGSYAFNDCSNLLNVRCYSIKPPVVGVGYQDFYSTLAGNAILHVPATALTKYKSTEPWSMFGNFKVLPGDVNGDGKWDMKDVNAILNYILNPYGSFDKDAADMNGDGIVNIVDIVLLLKII